MQARLDSTALADRIQILYLKGTAREKMGSLEYAVSAYREAVRQFLKFQEDPRYHLNELVRALPYATGAAYRMNFLLPKMLQSNAKALHERISNYQEMIGLTDELEALIADLKYDAQVEIRNRA